MQQPDVIVIGAGIAGCEAAWQAARLGASVALYEMRPERQTPMHSTPLAGELIGTACLGMDTLDRATGLLMSELRAVGSLIADAADKSRIGGVGLFEVGRRAFAQAVTARIVDHPLIDLRRAESALPTGRTPTVIATGPGTTSAVARGLHLLTGREFEFYYGATEPLIAAGSVDLGRVWRGRRFDDQQPEHTNCAIDRGAYERLTQMLAEAAAVLPEGVEPQSVMHDYMPVELMLTNTEKPLHNGPLNPAGLIDPESGEQPFAVCQLSDDEADRTTYRVTNFATGVPPAVQSRALGCARGLEQAEFVRHGRLHRGAFLPARGLLDAAYRLRHRHSILIAGALCGLQGYAAVAGSGWLAGVNAARLAGGLDPVVFPSGTLNGALSAAVRQAQGGRNGPIGVNYGMLPAGDDEQGTKEQKRLMRAARALSALEDLRRQVGLSGGEV